VGQKYPRQHLINKREDDPMDPKSYKVNQQLTRRRKREKKGKKQKKITDKQIKITNCPAIAELQSEDWA
jgi:hypothetical protein